MRPHPRSKKRYWRDRQRRNRWSRRMPLINGQEYRFFLSFDLNDGAKTLPVEVHLMPAIGPFESKIGAGIGMLDVFMIGEQPGTSMPTMRERLLMDECRRHFPLTDAASQKSYADQSIKMAEQKHPDDETTPEEQTPAE